MIPGLFGPDYPSWTGSGLWLPDYHNRKWHRPKKHKPQHRKQKMLALRRALKAYPLERVLHYLDKQMDSPATIFTLFRVDGSDYYADDVKRVMLSANSHAKRLLKLRYYW